MPIYDISLPLSPHLPTWPGDPPLVIERFAQMEAGAPANVSRISASLHVGTHVDAPFHFLGGQTPTVDQLPLRVLNGRASVVHIPDEVDLITAQVIANLPFPRRTRRLLFKTRNSALWEKGVTTFQEDFVALSADAAQELVNLGIRLVGVDYLSVAPFHDPLPTHQILLRGGVVLVEGLNLSAVPAGRYTLHCLPLRIAADGAPARAILIGP